MCRRVGAVRHRLDQPRQPGQIGSRTAEGELDRLVHAERAADRRPGTQPLSTPSPIHSCPAERKRLPDETLLAQPRKAANGCLEGRRIASEEAIERAVELRSRRAAPATQATRS